jgi:hypothetical protein
MIDTVLRPGVRYSFYPVPYSMASIRKLDKQIIRVTKTICGLPKSTPNITTQIPRHQFGLDAFSFKTEYLTCIGNQLRDALNDPSKLGKIYRGLTYHILAKYEGSQHLPLLTEAACIHSPISRTLLLLKKEAHIHLRGLDPKFPLIRIP